MTADAAASIDRAAASGRGAGGREFMDRRNERLAEGPRGVQPVLDVDLGAGHQADVREHDIDMGAFATIHDARSTSAAAGRSPNEGRSTPPVPSGSAR